MELVNGSGEPAKKPVEPKVSRLLIQFDESGRLEVMGPITNPGLCLLMLELAKKVVLEPKPKSASGLILPDKSLLVPASAV